MTDRLTAEDAARLLEGSTPGPWFTESDGIYNDTRSYMVTVIGDSDQDRRDAVLIAAAPALAAALADSVPKAEHEEISDRHFAAFQSERARTNAALTEVTRLREAMEAVRAELKEWRWDCVNEALTIIDAALAEGSDVLPTQRDH